MKKSDQVNKQLVFIDDSGDPGFKKAASSSAFVMAGAVIINSETTLKINQEINRLRQELGWRENEEFKFHKSSRKVKLKFLETINKYDFQIYGVFVRKSNYSNVFQNINGEKLYNWTIKELLDIIPLYEASVKIDGKYGKKYKLNDVNFPTINPNDPYKLTDEENEVVERLCESFRHSPKLNEHIKFIYQKGEIYTIFNSNLLFHACIPMEEDGSFKKVNFMGQEVSGKAYLDLFT